MSPAATQASDLVLTAYAFDGGQGRLVASDPPESIPGLLTFRVVAGGTYAIAIGATSLEDYVAQFALMGETFDDSTRIALDSAAAARSWATWASTGPRPSSTSSRVPPAWSPSRA